MIEGNNKGFSFYENYWESISHLDKEMGQAVAYGIVKYGITKEMPDPTEEPIVYSLVQSFALSIDRSAENFNKSAERGAKGGRPDSLTNEQILKLEEMAKLGKSAKDIAEALNISINTVYKRPEWKNRGKNKNITNQGGFSF